MTRYAPVDGGPRGWFHPSNVRPRGSACECEFPGPAAQPVSRRVVSRAPAGHGPEAGQRGHRTRRRPAPSRGPGRPSGRPATPARRLPRRRSAPTARGGPRTPAAAPSARPASTFSGLRTPPSTNTGRPAAAARTAGNASAVGRAWSSCRPPWLDTMTPAAPADRQAAASSARSTPLTTTGSPPLISASQPMSSRLAGTIAAPGTGRPAVRGCPEVPVADHAPRRASGPGARPRGCRR